MPVIRWLVTVGICLLPIWMLAWPASSQTPEQSVEQFVDQWCDAFADNDDASMQGHYLNHPQLQLVVSSGAMYAGIDEVLAIYRQSYQEVRFVSATLNDRTVLVQDSSACVTGDFLAKTTFLNDGREFLVRCRTSLSLANTDDGWRIIGEHSSPLPGIQRLESADDQQ